MNNEPLHFKKNAILIRHKKNQQKLIKTIIDANIKIEKELRTWEMVNQKCISCEKYHLLPNNIQKLVSIFNYNEKALRAKIKKYRFKKNN